MKQKILIIFDCDGTLVDTEWVSAVAFSESLAQFGLTYTPEAIRQEFLGIANTVIMATINARHGTSIGLDAVNVHYTKAMSVGMRQNMRVFPESLAFVNDLAASGDYVLCVGSNGNKSVVIEELEVGGFLGAIAKADIYTASDVARPKPYPDLFLHVAALKGFDPANCVVVEDSATGAKAGIDAGMHVIGYLGLAHDREMQNAALWDVGVTDIIDHLPDLAAYL